MLTVLYIIAITAEAMTGALSAGRRHMDWFGVVLIAVVTALGGGSARDVLIGNYPLTWVRHPEYLMLCVCAALITIVIAPLMKRLKSLFLVLDALGLVAFTLIGCKVALAAGHGMIIAVVCGVMTGVFGGIIRDTLCNDVPLVFQRELYASVALVTACAYLFGRAAGVDESQMVLLALFGGFLFRLLAMRNHWEMPKFVYQDDVH
ncbi:MAG: trimeric intracellular cation channel family protein [Pseudomonadota bacterium]|nr:trimeric intracellular cation channel family protein [Pseudomonadota bacterium]